MSKQLGAPNISSRRKRAALAATELWTRQGMHVCRLCKEPVIIVIHDGKFIHLDAHPNWERGNVFILGRSTDSPRAETDGDPGFIATRRADGIPYHTAHDGTCRYGSSL